MRGQEGGTGGLPRFAPGGGDGGRRAGTGRAHGLRRLPAVTSDAAAGPASSPAGGSGGGSGHGSGGPVVGFDLDQTLVDSGPRISSCLRAALAEVGLPFDEAAAEASRGLPLARTLAALVPAARATPELLEDVAARYRAQDRRPDGEGGHPLVGAMPHARAALEAVVRGGGRAVVVSAKREEAVGRVLAWAGLDDLVSAVAGDRFGVEKAGALREHGAAAYVGDHPADVDAALAAGAAPVAVATGAHGQEELRARGAGAVLADLSGFPAWLAGLRLPAPGAPPPPRGSAPAGPAGGAPRG